jgi:hypothetical protein
MALIDYVYLDAGLTDQFDDAVDNIFAGAVNGSSGTGVFYIGSPIATDVLQADSAPGVDPLTVDIVDQAPGSGVEASHWRLAVSEAGLLAATPGAQLSLGATINGGSGNAVPVWYQWDNSSGSGSFTDILLNIPAIRQVA